MREFEAAPWALAGGSACVFAVSVVLDRLPWQVAFAACALAVVAWAGRSRPLTGAALGGIGWMCVTGFDVHRLGYIAVTGSDDAARMAVLVLAGFLAASLRAVLAAVHGRRRADPAWGDFHEAALSAEFVPADLTRHPQRVPLPRPFGVSSLESSKGSKADG